TPMSFPVNPSKSAVRWKLRCVFCKERVTSSDALKGHAYYAFGGMWHAEHMNCAKCKVNVSEIPFCQSPTDPAALMCTDCYMIDNNPDCAVCGTRLYETALDAGGKMYHKDCFKCKTCKNPCNDGHYMTDDTGAIYDVDCYHIMALDRDYGTNLGGNKE
ncbi:hypothetical protein PFISCL1PPCAC_18689, partial [Pristionchus fissidentatus]